MKEPMVIILSPFTVLLIPWFLFFGWMYWLQLSDEEGAHVVTFLFSFFFKLENEKAEHAKEMRGLERQIAQLRDQLLKARRGLEDQARVS